MLTLPRSARIVLATEPVDMRRGHDGLCAIVRNQWRLDPFAGHLLVFLDKRADRVKCLFWDRAGFVLYYKRQGVLVVDAYTGHNVVTKPDGRDRASCNSHARRKFREALGNSPEAQRAIDL